MTEARASTKLAPAGAKWKPRTGRLAYILRTVGVFAFFTLPYPPTADGLLTISAHLDVEKCLPGNAPRHPSGDRNQVLSAGATFIWRLEAASIHPYWPGGASGITLGIGWDVGHHTESDLRKTWRELDQVSLEALALTAGKKGDQASRLLPMVKDILISESLSRRVFIDSMPRYYDEMLGIFPESRRLPTDVQVSLLSLVFNRGSGLGKALPEDVDARFEMRTLQGAVRDQDITGIYYRFSNMIRLWEHTPLGKGLANRRRSEMRLIRPYICF